MLTTSLYIHIATPTPVPTCTADLRSGAKLRQQRSGAKLRQQRSGAKASCDIQDVQHPGVLKNHWPTFCSKACIVLRDWRIVALEENGGFLDLLQGIRNHHEESFVMPKDFSGSPLKCELGQLKESDFQMVKWVWRWVGYQVSKST